MPFLTKRVLFWGLIFSLLAHAHAITNDNRDSSLAEEYAELEELHEEEQGNLDTDMATADQASNLERNGRSADADPKFGGNHPRTRRWWGYRRPQSRHHLLRKQSHRPGKPRRPGVPRRLGRRVSRPAMRRRGGRPWLSRRRAVKRIGSFLVRRRLLRFVRARPGVRRYYKNRQVVRRKKKSIALPRRRLGFRRRFLRFRIRLPPKAMPGKWSPWTKWSSCSVTCGRGRQSRTRVCQRTRPLFHYQRWARISAWARRSRCVCKGPSAHARHCQLRSCAVDGKWSAWSAWSSCSTSCGSGEQTRTRQCTNPAPSGGGKPCVGKSSESRSCPNAKPCPKLCSSQPCQNDGKCIDLRDRFTCSCAPGYTGELCEKDIDECESVPCQNGAACIDGVNRFRCNCQPGYTGTLCDKDVNECASSPCQNGGQCIDLVNGFECTCQPGYTGDNCETDIDECDSSPCQNDGQCIDLVNSFQCTCQPGYTGETCSENINECISAPCLNGGTCIDLVNGFQCLCTAGNTGTLCDTVSVVNGNWAIWGQWSPCSLTCGDGIRSRVRSCSDPPPGPRGEYCDGEPQEVEQCNDRPCPIDGQWSVWSTWSTCSQTCGEGVQVRFRTCTNPEPKFGGKDCRGKGEDDRKCMVADFCPGNGDPVWSPWGHWSACSASCGTGHRRRLRVCKSNAPFKVDCTGDFEEKEPCNTHKC